MIELLRTSAASQSGTILSSRKDELYQQFFSGRNNKFSLLGVKDPEARLVLLTFSRQRDDRSDVSRDVK